MNACAVYKLIIIGLYNDDDNLIHDGVMLILMMVLLRIMPPIMVMVLILLLTLVMIPMAGMKLGSSWNVWRSKI